MISFTAPALTFALAALSSALPSLKRALSPNEFSLALVAEGYPRLSLNAIPSDTIGSLDLVFERLAAYPGTFAFLNGTYLDFDVGGVYAMYFPDVGDNYGFSVPITAIYSVGQNNGRSGFEIASDGSLSARLTSAEQSFFACNSTLNGVDQFALRWGVFKSDGGSPDGCIPARLVQNGNVEY